MPVRYSSLPEDETNPFKERILEKHVNVAEDQLMGTETEKLGQIAYIMQLEATDLARSLRKRSVVDGELTSESQYRYFTEEGPSEATKYRLGDLVEVAGDFTDLVPGVVTEFIQTSDATGARAYPAISAPPVELPIDEGGVIVT